MTGRYGTAMHLPDPERARRTFAAMSIAQLEDREHYFLDLATHAPDDDSARLLEAYADDAYRDALAIASEHGLGC